MIQKKSSRKMKIKDFHNLSVLIMRKIWLWKNLSVKTFVPFDFVESSICG